LADAEIARLFDTGVVQGPTDAACPVA